MSDKSAYSKIEFLAKLRFPFIRDSVFGTVKCEIANEFEIVIFTNGVAYVDWKAINKIEYLSGENEDSVPFTAVNCTLISQIGFRLKYSFSYLVKGISISNENDYIIHKSESSFKGLSVWTNNHIPIVLYSNQNKSIRINHEVNPDIKFDINQDISGELRVGLVCLPESSAIMHLLSSSSIYLFYKKPCSVKNCIEHSRLLEKFISLFRLENSPINELDVFTDQGAASLVINSSKYDFQFVNNEFSTSIPFDSIRNEFEKVISNWFDIAPKYELVIDSVLSVTPTSYAFGYRNKFLNLCQSIELYCRLSAKLAESNKILDDLKFNSICETIKPLLTSEEESHFRKALFHANERSFISKVRSFLSLDKPFAMNLFKTKNSNEFSNLHKKIREARDSLTHLNHTSIIENYSDKDITRLTEQLHIYFLNILLIDIGVPKQISNDFCQKVAWQRYFHF